MRRFGALFRSQSGHAPEQTVQCFAYNMYYMTGFLGIRRIFSVVEQGKRFNRCRRLFGIFRLIDDTGAHGANVLERPSWDVLPDELVKGYGLPAFEQARQRFYASGGNREAYLAFLPFNSFQEGFYGYVKKSELVKTIASKTTPPWAS